VFVEQIALDAYNLGAVQSESLRIQNFINGKFIERIPFLVTPSEVEESLDVLSAASYDSKAR
jgi:hypothetical protein